MKRLFTYIILFLVFGSSISYSLQYYFDTFASYRLETTNLIQDSWSVKEEIIVTNSKNNNYYLTITKYDNLITSVTIFHRHKKMMKRHRFAVTPTDGEGMNFTPTSSQEYDISTDCIFSSHFYETVNQSDTVTKITNYYTKKKKKVLAELTITEHETIDDLAFLENFKYGILHHFIGQCNELEIPKNTLIKKAEQVFYNETKMTNKTAMELLSYGKVSFVLDTNKDVNTVKF